MIKAGIFASALFLTISCAIAMDDRANRRNEIIMLVKKAMTADTNEKPYRHIIRGEIVDDADNGKLFIETRSLRGAKLKPLHHLLLDGSAFVVTHEPHAYQEKTIKLPVVIVFRHPDQP